MYRQWSYDCLVSVEDYNVIVLDVESVLYSKCCWRRLIFSCQFVVIFVVVFPEACCHGKLYTVEWVSHGSKQRFCILRSNIVLLSYHIIILSYHKIACCRLFVVFIRLLPHVSIVFVVGFHFILFVYFIIIDEISFCRLLPMDECCSK